MLHTVSQLTHTPDDVSPHPDTSYVSSINRSRSCSLKLIYDLKEWDLLGITQNFAGLYQIRTLLLAPIWWNWYRHKFSTRKSFSW